MLNKTDFVNLNKIAIGLKEHFATLGVKCTIFDCVANGVYGRILSLKPDDDHTTIANGVCGGDRIGSIEITGTKVDCTFYGPEVSQNNTLYAEQLTIILDLADPNLLTELDTLICLRIVKRNGIYPGIYP